jgi:hypothetical protein
MGTISLSEERQDDRLPSHSAPPSFPASRDPTSQRPDLTLGYRPRSNSFWLIIDRQEVLAVTTFGILVRLIRLMLSADPRARRSLIERWKPL